MGQALLPDARCLKENWELGRGVTEASLDCLASLLPPLTLPFFPLPVFPLAGDPMKTTQAPGMETPAEHLAVPCTGLIIKPTYSGRKWRLGVKVTC